MMRSFITQFLWPATAVALVPLPLAIMMQMALGSPEAILPAMLWLVLAVVYWWPVGLLLYWWPRGELTRILVGFMTSIPLYVLALVLVYPAVGAHFAPKDGATWAIYMSSSPWMFGAVYLLYRLVCKGGRWTRAVHLLAVVVVIAATAAPLAFRAAIDRYTWPPQGPAGSLTIITHTRMVDVAQGCVREDVNVHVRDGRIVAVVNALEDAERGDVIDAQGNYLTPGLSDVHGHLQVPIEELFASFSIRYFLTQLLGQYAGHRQAYLSAGVTTVRDVGGPAANAFALRHDLIERALLGPRLLTVGRLVTSPGGHPVGTIWTPAISHASAIQVDDIATMRRELDADWTAYRPDAVKFIYGTIGRAPTRLRPELLEDGIRWAAEHHLISIVHAETTEEVRTAIAAGATGVEHVTSMETLPADLVSLVAARRPFIDPTFGEYRALLRLQGLTPDAINARLKEKGAFVKTLWEAGGRLVVGTDAPLVGYGVGVHAELRELQSAGLTATDILRIATINNAAYLGLAGESGQILPGFRADLVLTRRNPLVDLETLIQPEWVMLAGVVVVQR